MTPINEILMLLGDKVVIIYEKDKEISELKEKLDEIVMENINLKAKLDG